MPVARAEAAAITGNLSTSAPRRSRRPPAPALCPIRFHCYAAPPCAAIPCHPRARAAQGQELCGRQVRRVTRQGVDPAARPRHQQADRDGAAVDARGARGGDGVVRGGVQDVARGARAAARARVHEVRRDAARQHRRHRQGHHGGAGQDARGRARRRYPRPRGRGALGVHAQPDDGRDRREPERPPGHVHHQAAAGRDGGHLPLQLPVRGTQLRGWGGARDIGPPPPSTGPPTAPCTSSSSCYRPALLPPAAP